jgi:galactose mutarotase-like enzyme
MSHLRLKSSELEVVIDATYGADILSLKTANKGHEVLLQTPWADRAEAVIKGEQRSIYLEPQAHWMEGYRGGWQMICPVAGPARVIHGAPLGFHGEAAISTWKVNNLDIASARMQLDLFSLPIRIEREVSVNGNEIEITDVITNLSKVELEFDYSSHPAFGGALLEGEVTIETTAQKFHLDEERESPHGVAGSIHDWPLIKGENGNVLDLSRLPSPPTSLGAFGYLSDFGDKKWYRVKNIEKNISFELEWESEFLDFAWFWLDFNSNQGSPWFGNVRTFAIEPSSTQTSGKNRRSILQLRGNQATTIKQKVRITSS